MLGDIYFRCKVNEKTEATVWWPVFQTKLSHVFIHGNHLDLLANYTPENLPTIDHVLEALRRRPDLFWLMDGNERLEKAEAVRLANRNPWIKIGEGSSYLSQISFFCGSSEAETLANISPKKLQEYLNQYGILKHTPVIAGEIQGAFDAIWY